MELLSLVLDDDERDMIACDCCLLSWGSFFSVFIVSGGEVKIPLSPKYSLICSRVGCVVLRRHCYSRNALIIVLIRAQTPIKIRFIRVI